MIDNILVPKHEVLSAEESSALLAKYKVTREELPKIKINDPALSNLKLGVGDIVKITRKNPIIRKTVYYRVVIGK